MQSATAKQPTIFHSKYVLILAACAAIGLLLWFNIREGASGKNGAAKPLEYKPRQIVDTSGFYSVLSTLKQWPSNATLEENGRIWQRAGYKAAQQIDTELANPALRKSEQVNLLVLQSLFYSFEGESTKAYAELTRARSLVEANDRLAEKFLYSTIYLQGVMALRRGEDENCILCRGESSCILPIAPAAVHTNPLGSRLAIKHFTEYLKQFPDDSDVRWLLNLAHMTLNEHPQKVDPKYLIKLDRFNKSEFDIGRFRDIGEKAGVNRLNQSGGAILDDFDNDGLLDIIVTAINPNTPMAFYRNKGDGTFEDRSAKAGLLEQLGGLNCVQTDYNNDGLLDIYVPRGAWLSYPMRPSLLKNTGGEFVDVTLAAGLLQPHNAIAARWADYDNDGHLDLLVCCDVPPNRLYRNQGNGTFKDVTAAAGLLNRGKECKGAAWIDYDNDGDPDLFLNFLRRPAQLFRNDKGKFTDVSKVMSIDGPEVGFSCWTWDYDNDGWLDLFATCYAGTVSDGVDGLQHQMRGKKTNRLFRNKRGKRFQDMTREAGLNALFIPMGSNFGDFDNDGYLDMYLGTGAPSLDFLVPNRMFKNVAGRRFADITASSGTGQLQKGHGVGCGDWDRDGDVDIFIQMGGATNGDRFHNILFQNPGQGNNWLTVKLIGKKTNRAAIGARIKVVTGGKNRQTIHRHVSSGSSFGANPLQQTIGLAKSTTVDLLEIYWPTSATTQRFRNIDANQAIEVTEFAKSYRKLNWKRIPSPK